MMKRGRPISEALQPSTWRFPLIPLTVMFVALALAPFGTADAQTYREWRNKENVLIATVQAPAKGNCAPMAICEDANDLNIGKDWEQVEVFLTEITWLPGSSSGTSISRLKAEIEAYKYDKGTGDLTVKLRSQIDNDGLHYPEFQFSYAIVATRDDKNLGYQPVRMHPFSNSCTGDTWLGCTSTAGFPSSLTQGWNFVGLGLQSIDMEVTGAKEGVDPYRIYFSGLGTSNPLGTAASQNLSCGILDATGALGFSCSNTGMVLSSKATVFDPGTNLQENFVVTSSSGYYRQTTDAPGNPDRIAALLLLNKFEFERNGYNGAPYFAPTYVLEAGCGEVDFDQNVGSYGMLYVDWVARWQDRTLVPWAWYDAQIGCRRSFLQAEDP
jgi:hypothetical protein